uniref:Ig-like domain-containing protein n=1 Tax=Macrostomum lignano TaxID=282301 RepID=A0A1I8FDV1_9PLAT
RIGQNAQRQVKLSGLYSLPGHESVRRRPGRVRDRRVLANVSPRRVVKIGASVAPNIDGKPEPKISWFVELSGNKTVRLIEASDSKYLVESLDGGKSSAVAHSRCHDEATYKLPSGEQHQPDRAVHRARRAVGAEVQPDSKPNYQVNEGEPLKLDVQISGRFILSEGATRLHVTPTVEADEGFFECIGLNSVAGSCTVIESTCLVPPKSTNGTGTDSPLKITAKIGEPLRIGCNVTGKPKPEIQWYFKGQRLSDADAARLEFERQRDAELRPDSHQAPVLEPNLIGSKTVIQGDSNEPALHGEGGSPGRRRSFGGFAEQPATDSELERLGASKYATDPREASASEQTSRIGLATGQPGDFQPAKTEMPAAAANPVAEEMASQLRPCSDAVEVQRQARCPGLRRPSQQTRAQPDHTGSPLANTGLHLPVRASNDLGTNIATYPGCCGAEAEDSATNRGWAIPIGKIVRINSSMVLELPSVRGRGGRPAGWRSPGSRTMYR